MATEPILIPDATAQPAEFRRGFGEHPERVALQRPAAVAAYPDRGNFVAARIHRRHNSERRA